MRSDEEFLGATAFSIAAGVPTAPPARVHKARPEYVPEGRVRSALQSVSYAMDRVGDVVGRLLFGKGLHGSWDSLAGQLRIHLFHDVGYVAVTDRRLLFLHPPPSEGSSARQRGRRSGSAPEEATPCWEAPMARVVAARPRPKGVRQRSRFDLLFADGSWIGLLTTPSGLRDPMAKSIHRAAG